MLLVLPDNVIAECSRTDCNRLGDNNKKNMHPQHRCWVASEVLQHPDDGNELLKHVGVNLEYINKLYYYFDAFVGYFITIYNITYIILCFVDRASRYIRVMKPTWCTVYLQFIQSINLYTCFGFASSPSSRCSNVYMWQSVRVLRLVDCQRAWMEWNCITAFRNVTSRGADR
jgi:hypothetical protein